MRALLDKVALVVGSCFSSLWIFHANGKEKKGWVAVLISGKTDFKTKANKRQRRTQHDDKGNNPMRGYNPSKHLCTQHRKHLNM